MPRAIVNTQKSYKIELEYQVFGDLNESKNETVVLVHGLGCQLKHWNQQTFIGTIVKAGYNVVIMDNRDIGFSTYLHEEKTENMIIRRLKSIINSTSSTLCSLASFAAAAYRIFSSYRAVTAVAGGATAAATATTSTSIVDIFSKALIVCGFLCYLAKHFNLWPQFRSAPPVYHLSAMADDVVGLLDHLNVRKAHIVGMSMGGMISQLVAINYPHRISTLTSIMSSTGSRDPKLSPSLAYLASLFLVPLPKADDTEGWIKHLSKNNKKMGVAYDSDTYDGVPREAFIRSVVMRTNNRTGILRQIEAIETAPPRDEHLSHPDFKVPTLIMSGKADPLVPHPNSIHMFNLITQGASRRSKAVKVHIKDGSNEGTEVVYKPTPLPVTKFGRGASTTEAVVHDDLGELAVLKLFPDVGHEAPDRASLMFSRAIVDWISKNHPERK